MLNNGDVFAGFTIERLLGQGGMGSVYLARHPRLGKLTALKLLNRELFADREIRARFEREADLVAQLDHPNIVEVYDRGTEDEQLWISMQFVDGVDAASVNVTQLPPDRAVQIIEGVAAALDYAYGMGVLHRDVKPANIILARAVAGHGERVFLTDFGIARLREDSTHLTQAGMFTATLAYASPEQMTGAHLDHTTDQYSLACALYWLLIGAGPYDSPHPTELIRGHLELLPPPVSLRRPGLTQAMDAVLTKAMAKRPIDRFPSCTDFANAARRALTAPVAPWPPSPAPNTPPPGYAVAPPTYGAPPPGYQPYPPGYLVPPNPAVPQSYPPAPTGYPAQSPVPAAPYATPGYSPQYPPAPAYAAPQPPAQPGYPAQPPLPEAAPDLSEQRTDLLPKPNHPAPETDSPYPSVQPAAAGQPAEVIQPPEAPSPHQEPGAPRDADEDLADPADAAQRSADIPPPDAKADGPQSESRREESDPTRDSDASALADPAASRKPQESSAVDSASAAAAARASAPTDRGAPQVSPASMQLIAGAGAVSSPVLPQDSGRSVVVSAPVELPSGGSELSVTDGSSGDGAKNKSAAEVGTPVGDSTDFSESSATESDSERTGERAVATSAPVGASDGTAAEVARRVDTGGAAGLSAREREAAGYPGVGLRNPESGAFVPSAVGVGGSDADRVWAPGGGKGRGVGPAAAEFAGPEVAGAQPQGGVYSGPPAGYAPNGVPPQQRTGWRDGVEPSQVTALVVAGVAVLVLALMVVVLAVTVGG